MKYTHVIILVVTAGAAWLMYFIYKSLLGPPTFLGWVFLYLSYGVGIRSIVWSHVKSRWTPEKGYQWVWLLDYHIVLAWPIWWLALVFNRYD